MYISLFDMNGIDNLLVKIYNISCSKNDVIYFKGRMKMDELWKDVDNTSGRYQISSKGNFRRRIDNGEYRDIKPSLDPYGYQYVDVIYDNTAKPKRVAIHRLVAMAFINNPYNLPIVHHIDDNKQNNHVSNLFWCTYAQNNSFKISANNGKMDGYREIEQYTLDGKYIKTWSSFIEATNSVRPNNSTYSNLISLCCRGKGGRKSAYGYIWKFGKGDPMYKPSIADSEETINELFRDACKKSPERVKEALLEIIMD
jgi:hypothetical protein